MSLFSFLKDAGEKIFGTSDSSTDKSAKATNHVQNYNIPGTKNIRVECNDHGKATVTGECESNSIKQLVLTAAGNIEGVKEVEDKIQVTSNTPGDEGEYYTVKAGDTLSKIAEHYYHNPNKYHIIFEANQPLLSDPNKIYPGQTLIIPKI